MASPGTELILGMARDPALGPLIVVGAGGVLTEYLAERAVALPPVSEAEAARMIAGLRVAEILAGVRGQTPCDAGALAGAIAAFSRLISDLGDYLDAFDVNPLFCSPSGVLVVDALALPFGAPVAPGGSRERASRRRRGLVDVPLPVDLDAGGQRVNAWVLIVGTAPQGTERLSA